jgi:methyl-accepting chemotaxis protein
MSAIEFCKIQEAQLAAARDKLRQSVSAIIDNLRGISHNITEISQDTQELSNDAAENEHSFLAEMEEHLAEVSSGLGQYGSASQELASLMRSVAPAIGDMASCLRDIERIEIAIERIALNACIKAAHLAEEGAALGVLAGGIQRLVGDTREQTAKVSEKLNSIISAAQELQMDNAVDKTDADLEVSPLIQEIGAILQSLRTLDDRAHSELKEVQEKGGLLSGDLQKACDEINVHERAAATINQVLSGLSQLSKQIESPFLFKELEKTGRRELEALQDNYTMKAERLVHVSIAAPEANIKTESILFETQNNPKSIKTNNKDKEDNLGDNVELF